MKILTEACGSLVAGYLIKAIKESGHISVSSDISSSNAGAYLADEFIQFPLCSDDKLWDKIEVTVKSKGINVIIPSFDEMLLGWAERKEYFKRKYDISIIISPVETIEIFSNKWLTYRFFSENGIPTPKTSCEQLYEFIKPIYGRGAKGQLITREKINMEGYISQELVSGQEYTVDCLFDKNGKPIYIIPRKRLKVYDGKSLTGQVQYKKNIIDFICDISKNVSFYGPINVQCFEKDENLSFIEINPRIGGGMALGFAASENWIPLIINNFCHGKEIKPKQINYNMKMYRYFDELFI